MNPTRELTRQAPRTGPWIIGYIAALGAGAAAVTNGIVTGSAMAAPFWAAMFVCAGMIVYTSWKRHRLLGTLSAAIREFWWRIVPAAGFMFTSFCLLAFAQMRGWDSQTHTVIAVLPILGFAGMVWAIHKYARDEHDEYLRSLAVRQLLIASFVALIGGLVWAVLQKLGLNIAPGIGLARSGDIGLILLLWFAGLGIGRVVIEQRP